MRKNYSRVRFTPMNGGIRMWDDAPEFAREESDMAVLTGASWFTMSALYNGLHLLVKQEEAREEPNESQITFYLHLLDLMTTGRIHVYIAKPPEADDTEEAPAVETEPSSSPSLFERLLHFLRIR